MSVVKFRLVFGYFLILRRQPLPVCPRIFFWAYSHVALHVRRSPSYSRHRDVLHHQHPTKTTTISQLSLFYTLLVTLHSVTMDSPMAISPQILAIQRERPPSLAASTRSGKDLLSDRDNIKTVFVPAQVYAFCTSPEHTVTAALANATVDSPVRMIAEHLFGLGYGSFQLFTGEASAAKPQAPKEPNVKGVKAWLSKLNLRPRKAARSAAVTQTPQDDDSSCNVSDDSDGDPTADDHWQKMRPLNEAELAEVLKCGQWRGAQPSSLFLNVSHVSAGTDHRSTPKPFLRLRRMF